MGRDNNIYGLDETSYAGKIASKALGSPKANESVKQDGAIAKGSTPDPTDVIVRSLKQDTTGKRSEGN